MLLLFHPGSARSAPALVRAALGTMASGCAMLGPAACWPLPGMRESMQQQSGPTNHSHARPHTAPPRIVQHFILPYALSPPPCGVETHPVIPVASRPGAAAEPDNPSLSVLRQALQCMCFSSSRRCARRCQSHGLAAASRFLARLFRGRARAPERKPRLRGRPA